MPSALLLGEVVALMAISAIVGALVFSLTIGRLRARRVASLADRLASATGEGRVGRIRVADGTLNRSLERLAARIAVVEGMATTDPLTGTLTRQACLRVLAEEIGRANRHERPLAVALIDIDHFKQVNDSHGHAAGDAALSHVAGLLMANIRTSDSLGRYGGEEFILVMPETDLDGGLASAENLRRIVGRGALQIVDQPIAVTISAGVTGRRAVPSLDLDAVLREADVALYAAKAQGRDQVQPYRAVDDEADVAKATIPPAARSHAERLGQAAFDASHEHLLGVLSERPGWAGGASPLIAALAGELAAGMGLPDGDVQRIRTASLLHDLGKLAIPDEILWKPAPLTAREWQAIVEHPKIGQVVLEQAGSIRDAAAIVLHHHEWFDGRGYPYGLAGTEIPLGSRIVAIADAYEAMISDRPYKRAMTHPEALAELRRQAGVQFDPDLVRIFEERFGEGIEHVRRRGASAPRAVARRQAV
ncbi:MAG TPA: diguanylate cyclase [Candidatus Limnocylindrales bacterium]|nr:diguanylate cyclase [Candidatus Limnocylindrales bacterium]